jgi:serine O-acetyltransferase
MEMAIAMRRKPVIGRLCHELLHLYGAVIPNEVEIGRDLHLEYRGMGTVFHPAVTIGDRVAIYHQVTLGQADGWVPWADSAMERIVIGDDVILFPGVKVLGGPGVTKVGTGTIVGANSVLTRSTGEWEVWAGAPARHVGERDRLSGPQRFL